ncbi:MAG TPA: PDZ domain-containing protein, partial [Gemmataceae bacterium]|nr:PDZ domain-containing protein [Gemmataceae bacterium]
ITTSENLNERLTMIRGQYRALWLRGAAGVLGVAVLVGGLGLAAASGDEPKQEDKKAEPKKEEPKKGRAKKPQPAATGEDEEPKQGRARKRLPFSGGEDFEEIFQNLPQGVNPEQMRQFQAEMQRMMQQMQRQIPGGFQGGAFGGFATPREGRLGVRVQTPSATLIEQLDLPKNQGLVIEDVQADSVASKAGIKNHDILLEFNGKPVNANPTEFVRTIQDVKADKPMDAVVLRKGKRETIKGVSLPEANAEAVPGFFREGPANRFGGAGGGFPNPGPFGGGGIGAAGAFGGPGGQQVMTSVFRSDDRFTARHQEGSLVLTVTGTVADGKAKVTGIHVQDGRESHDYESVEKVAEQYRDKVKNLIEMSTKSSVKVEIKTPKIEP